VRGDKKHSSVLTQMLNEPRPVSVGKSCKTVSREHIQNTILLLWCA